MKTLYESILDSDIMDKADKKAELIFMLRDPLLKGFNNEYTSYKVSKLLDEYIKKNDILPHEDEWSEIIKWFNTYLNINCVQEAPVEYKINVHKKPGKGVVLSEYYVLLAAYWRTFYTENGEQKITNKLVGAPLIYFRYEIERGRRKELKENYVLEVRATSDKKWVKRLANKFDRKPESGNYGNCYFVL